MIGRMATLSAALLVGLTTLALAGDEPLPVDPATGRVVIQRVVPIAGATADELLSRARAWVVDTYGRDGTVRLDDPAARRLIVGCVSPYAAPGAPNLVGYTLTIETRDGRARVTAEVGAVALRGDMLAMPDWLKAPDRRRYDAAVGDAIRAAIASLASALASPSPVPGGDQW